MVAYVCLSFFFQPHQVTDHQLAERRETVYGFFILLFFFPPLFHFLPFPSPLHPPSTPPIRYRAWQAEQSKRATAIAARSSPMMALRAKPRSTTTTMRRCPRLCRWGHSHHLVERPLLLLPLLLLLLRRRWLLPRLRLRLLRPRYRSWRLLRLRFRFPRITAVLSQHRCSRMTHTSTQTRTQIPAQFPWFETRCSPARRPPMGNRNHHPIGTSACPALPHSGDQWQRPRDPIRLLPPPQAPPLPSRLQCPLVNMTMASVSACVRMPTFSMWTSRMCPGRPTPNAKTVRRD